MTEPERLGVAGERDMEQLRQLLQDEQSRLARWAELTIQMGATPDLQDLLRLVMDSTGELLRVQTCSLMLVDEETNEMTFEVATGKPGEEVVKYRLPPGQGVAGWVVQAATPLIVNDPTAEPRHYDRFDKSTGFETRNLIAAPLIVRGRVIGVVEAINKRDGSDFNDEDLRLTVALTVQAALAIDNARMYTRLTNAVERSRLSFRL